MRRVMQRENRRLRAGGAQPLHDLFQGLPQFRDIQQNHIRLHAIQAFQKRTPILRNFGRLKS